MSIIFVKGFESWNVCLISIIYNRTSVYLLRYRFLWIYVNLGNTTCKSSASVRWPEVCGVACNNPWNTFRDDPEVNFLMDLLTREGFLEPCWDFWTWVTSALSLAVNDFLLFADRMRAAKESWYQDFICLFLVSYGGGIHPTISTKN